MLPPGALRYLKGHPDGIVTVVLGAVAFGVIGSGLSEWPAVVALSVLCGFYHTRRTAAERHQRDMAQAKVDQAVAVAAAVRAQYLEGLSKTQASLPFDKELQPITPNKPTGRKGSKP